MNYMPDMAHFAFPKAAAGRITITSLSAHLQRMLPYTDQRRQREARPEVWIGGHGNGASVEFIRLSKEQRRGLVRANPGFEPAEQMIRLCSGPNHDYSYLPIFYDVELGILQLEGVCRICAENEVRPLAAMERHFEWVAGRMAKLSVEEHDELAMKTDIALAMLRLTEVIPAVTMSPSIAPWLLQGLVDDDDARADRIRAHLLRLRPRSVQPRLEAMIRDPTHERSLERLLEVYRALTLPGEEEPRTPESPAPGIAATDPERGADRDGDDPWGRWVDLYLTACRADPGPLVAALTEATEVQELFDLADMGFFIARTQDRPDFSPLLDAYIEREMEGNTRFEQLIGEIAALLRERAEGWTAAHAWFPPGTLDPACAEVWTLAREHVYEDLRPPLRAIEAALRGEASASAAPPDQG